MRPSSRRYRFAALGLAGLLVGSTVVLADAGEADRLRNLFESYLGAPAPGTASAVSVTPSGDGYDVVVDLDRLAAPLAAHGPTVKAGRHVSRLTPAADGTWRSRSDRFDPIEWSFAGRSGRITFEGWRADGDFSPALGTFSRQTIRLDRLTSSQSVPATADTPRIDLTRVDEKIDVAITAKPAAGGTGADVALTQTAGPLSETLSLTEGGAAGLPDMEAKLDVSAARSTVDVEGLRTEALLALWRRLVAHHAPGDFAADQVEWKARLRDLGPLFARWRQTTAIDGLELQTPVGFRSIGRAEVSIDASGATDAGAAEVTTTLSGLQIHSLFIPTWANRLIPADLALHARASGWNAASALALVLDRADFSSDEGLDAATRAEVLARLVPKEGITIDVSGNRVKATDWTVDLDGRIVATADGVHGTLTVRARGLEAAASALRDPAAGEAGRKAADELALALTFAESVDGALVWRFDVDGGAVSVNGRRLSSPPGGDGKPAPADPDKI